VSETRKLAAILVSDVVGYSRLAGADEDRILARLRTLRSDIIDPAITVHHGRIVKRTGDGSIVKFRSVVDAVRCAIEVQNAMVGLPPSHISVDWTRRVPPSRPVSRSTRPSPSPAPAPPGLRGATIRRIWLSLSLFLRACARPESPNNDRRRLAAIIAADVSADGRADAD
jgi:hypothetical protein